MTLRDALAEAARHIDALDARVLLRSLLAVDDAYLIAHGDRTLTAREERQYRMLAARRVAGEPVAYITGEREFYGRLFAVSPAVLIPRPDTERLVELALERLPRHEPRAVLDLGTGSGCIALSIAAERGRAHVTAIDASATALVMAQRNASRLGLTQVLFHIGRWFEPVQGQHFDLIVSNPPYVADADSHLAEGDVRFEPRSALTAGVDGLADIRHIVGEALHYLAPGGCLLFEHGYDQAERCRALLNDAGFAEVQSWRDLAGIERVSGGVLP